MYGFLTLVPVSLHSEQPPVPDESAPGIYTS